MPGPNQKIALVTGISRGIGRELGAVFRENGYFVAGVSRSKPAFAVDEWIACDLSSDKERETLIQKVTTRFERLDVLINNAGMGLYSTWAETAPGDLKRVFEVNFFSAVEFTRALLPLLRKTRGGVINVSSVAGTFYVPCMGGYSATKFAMNAFSDSLRVEEKPRGVHVCTLAVGRINTGFSRFALGNRTPPHTPGAGDARVLAKKAFRAFRRKNRRIVYPGWYRLLFAAFRLMPGVYDALNIRKWKLDEPPE